MLNYDNQEQGMGNFRPLTQLENTSNTAALTVRKWVFLSALFMLKLKIRELLVITASLFIDSLIFNFQ